MSSDNDDDQLGIVSFKMTSSTSLAAIIVALLFDKKDAVGTMLFNQAGIRIIVDRIKSVQARAYLKKELLDDYEVNESCEVRVNLSLIHRCLTIFSEKSAHLEMIYRGYGQPIIFLLEDQGVVTECQINTLEAVPLTDFNFRSSAIINRAIIKSSYLREALLEMDVPGTQSIELEMSPTPPNVKFTSISTSAQCEVVLPDDPAVFPVLTCDKQAAFRYSIQLIRPTMKALGMAEQTNLRMNSQGMLLMQHSIRGSDHCHIKNWIEFTICPQVQDDDPYQL